MQITSPMTQTLFCFQTTDDLTWATPMQATFAA